MDDNFVGFFAEIIRTRAFQRESINTRYQDERNVRTIAGLNELADYVEGLTPADPSIAVIAGLWEAQAHDESIGPAFDEQLFRFRFNEPDASCETFLKHLAQVLMEEFSQFGGDLNP